MKTCNGQRKNNRMPLLAVGMVLNVNMLDNKNVSSTDLEIEFFRTVEMTHLRLYWMLHNRFPTILLVG